MSARGRDAAQQEVLQKLAGAQQEAARQSARDRRTVLAADTPEAHFIASQTGTAFETADYCYEERGAQVYDVTNGQLPFDERYIRKTIPGGQKTITEINHQFAQLAQSSRKVS